MPTTFQQRLQMKRLSWLLGKLRICEDPTDLYYLWVKRFDWDGY